MTTLPGQSGIRLRAALARGEGAAAAGLVGDLDTAHRIELLLGAAIRDARGEWAAARAWLAAEAGEGTWADVCEQLTTPSPDHTLDDLASAYVAEGRVPATWRADGADVATFGEALVSAGLGGAEPDLVVAAAYARGVAGSALVGAVAAAFTSVNRHSPLLRAVETYYRAGTIHALGPRPMLVLAAALGDANARSAGLHPGARRFEWRQP